MTLTRAMQVDKEALVYAVKEGTPELLLFLEKQGADLEWVRAATRVCIFSSPLLSSSCRTACPRHRHLLSIEVPRERACPGGQPRQCRKCEVGLPLVLFLFLLTLHASVVRLPPTTPR